MGKTREELWDILQPFCKLRVPKYPKGGFCYKLRKDNLNGTKRSNNIFGDCFYKKCPIIDLILNNIEDVSYD